MTKNSAQAYLNFKESIQKLGVVTNEVDRYTLNESECKTLWDSFERNKNYLDKNFYEQLVHDESSFVDRVSELYFVESLLNNKLTIEHKKDHKKDEGPDIYINDIHGWGEFTTAHDAEISSINRSECSIEILNAYTASRLINSLTKKIKQIKSHIKKKIIKDNEPVILFISTSGLSIPYFRSYDSDIECLKCFFPIQPTGLVSLIPNKKAPYLVNKPFYKLNIMIEKWNKKEKKNVETLIPNDYFLNEEYQHISAIVISYERLLNTAKDKLGYNFIVIHNPLAINPISDNMFKCKAEFKVRVEKCKIIVIVIPRIKK
jgi:hypothetical protein